MSKGKKLTENINEVLSDNTRKLTKIDFIILATLIIIYSVISFWNLGSLDMPKTYKNFKEIGEEVTLEVKDQAKVISKIRYFAGPKEGKFKISYSTDGNTYLDLENNIEFDTVFAWKDYEINKLLKYIKISSLEKDEFLGDVQMYDAFGEKVLTLSSDDQSVKLTDELKTVPENINHLNSSYFDEIYFARSAYEYLNNMPTNEWVHPPLGKLIQAIPILILGMSTFAYRLMGNLAGIMMIPVIYIFAKDLFKNRKWALLAGILMMLDGFHFAHTRMGTVDSFLVLFIMLAAMFMYKYMITPRNYKLKKRLNYLLLSSIFIGCSIATKWTGLYAGFALALAFLVDLLLKNKNNDSDVKQENRKILLYTICVFTIIPLLIYILSYLLFPNVYPNRINSIFDIFKQTSDMYKYHSLLDATHPFTSKWYTWPLMLKPVWYHVTEYTGNLKETIVGLGNPAIWWFGILSSIYVLVDSVRNRIKKKESMYILLFIVCLWLPYVFIGRIMFMYHYFPVLPFIMLANVALIKWITERIKNNSVYYFYIGVVLLLFIYFYPVVSGMLTSTNVIESLKWFKGIWFF